ncbi:MAG: heavy-metal-associated domain-containing protein, partial [Lutibacter sp.]|nr:heavy-metal-associated domain-containing protein [Lutibacter sp.]
MRHTYKITGMSCSGCKTNVEKAFGNLKEVQKVTVNLKSKEVVLEMTSHIIVKKLQEILLKNGLHYTIEPTIVAQHVHQSHEHTSHSKEANNVTSSKHTHNHDNVTNGNGVFYCPMHCEGKKAYNKSGNCPVCGMDLIEQPKMVEESQFT